jgi:DNA-binding transcriptional ArsR family regulator
VTDVSEARADPTRRAILDELADRGPQTLFELCSRLAMKHGAGSTGQAISQHLAVLEEAGLVETRLRGRYELHTLVTTPLEQIAGRWLQPHDQEENERGST